MVCGQQTAHLNQRSRDPTPLLSCSDDEEGDGLTISSGSTLVASPASNGRSSPATVVPDRPPVPQATEDAPTPSTDTSKAREESSWGLLQK